MVEDSKQNRSYILNLDIISFRPERLRVDVTSTIGSHLATVTMRDNKVSYILLREKKYFEGKPNSQVLKPVLSMELDPRVIIDLLFDLPPREKGWECQRDENDYLTRCHNTGRKITVVWKKRLGRQRVLVISSKLAKLQLNLRKFRSKVEENDEIFVLKSPRGFSKVKSR